MGDVSVQGKLGVSDDITAENLNAKGNVLVGTGAASRASGIQAKDGWVITGKGLASGNVLAGTDARMSTDVGKHDQGIVAGSTGVWSYGDLWAKRDIYNEDGNLYVRRKTAKNGNVVADGDITAKRSISGRTVESEGTVTAEGSLVSKGGALQLKTFRAEANTSCAGMEGGIAVNNAGRVVSCQHGTWQISLVTRVQTQYVDRPVPWGYRDWNIASIGSDVQEYRFGNAKVCRLTSNQSFNPATVDSGISPRYLRFEGGEYILTVPKSHRAAMQNLSVSCIYNGKPDRAYAVRDGRRDKTYLRPSGSDTFDGNTARNFVQENPASTEYQTFEYDRFQYLAGDAGHHYQLGDWDNCVIDYRYGDSWAGGEVTLYAPQTYYTNKGWVFRVKKRDGRAICWRNRV